MSDERKMILHMLQEGKITAIEAEKLLKALAVHDQHETAESDEVEEVALSEYVDWDSWDDRKQAYKQKASGFTISRYIENFIQKLRDTDLDFNFGSYETVNHIYQDHAEHVANLSFDVGNGDVTVKLWDENFIQVDCSAKVYKVSHSAEAKQRFLQDTRFDVVNDTLVFACERRDIKVNTVVSVPKQKYSTINMTVFNGDVEGIGLSTTDLYAKTVNGNLALTSLQADKLRLETGNGTIGVTGGTINEAELESLNGAITLTGSCRDVTAETFSGRITTELTHTEVVTLRSVLGSVDVTVPKDVQINGELLSSVGSIHCELHSFEILREKKDIAQRLLKFVSNRKIDSLLTLDATTKTGTITVRELV